MLLAELKICVCGFNTNWGEDFRYTCEQNEGMAGYGWDEYDIRTGGRETIHDAGNNLDLTIDFVKVPGGNNGGNWGARIKGELRKGAAPNQPTTVVFAAAMEGSGTLEVANEFDGHGFEGDVKLNGKTAELGDFTIDITDGPASNSHPFHVHPSYKEKPLDRTLVSSVQMPEELLWQTKRMYFEFKESTKC